MNGMEFMGTTITVLRPRDYRAGEEDPNYVPGVVGSIVADTSNKAFWDLTSGLYRWYPNICDR